MKKRKTLRERAKDYAKDYAFPLWRGQHYFEGPIDAWLAGYRAAQRDMRKEQDDG